MIVRGALISLVGVLVASTGRAAGQTVHCGASSYSHVSTAYAFVLEHQRDIGDHWQREFLPKMQGWRTRQVISGLADTLLSRWLDATGRDVAPEVTCAPCPEGRVGYHARGRINLCYENLVNATGRLCSIVEALAHEIGHHVGWPTGSLHRDPTASHSRDSVYALGWAAHDLCVQQGQERFLDEASPTPPDPSDAPTMAASDVAPLSLG